MMPGQQSVDDLGNDGVLIAHDSGEQRPTYFETLEEIAPDFFPDGASPQRSLRPPAVLEFTYGAWLDHDWIRSRTGNNWQKRKVSAFMN
jgi:hypothetical protein